jgi:hypothetical protein
MISDVLFEAVETIKRYQAGFNAASAVHSTGFPRSRR